jgi:hypothetical protein
VSFSRFSKYDVASEAVDFVLPEIPGEMTLKVLSAGPSNGPYMAAALRLKPAKRRVTTDSLVTDRESDKAMFAKFIIVGWANVTNDTGLDVPFSPDKARELLDALPDWIFDELRRFCLNVTNFVTSDVDVKN